MKADDARRLKELEAENARLKRIVADQVVEVAALKEISKRNWRARRAGAMRSACFTLYSPSESASR